MRQIWVSRFLVAPTAGLADGPVRVGEVVRAEISELKKDMAGRGLP